MMSNAQDSEATTKWSPRRPSASGRSPAGSRNAHTRSLVMTTVEKAPCSVGRTSAIASSMVGASWVESSAAMISESDVERKETPRSISSAWSSTALMRLPLWARATSRTSARQTGCVFSHEFAPVVE